MFYLLCYIVCFVVASFVGDLLFFLSDLSSFNGSPAERLLRFFFSLFFLVWLFRFHGERSDR
jgi:hypothetical protein